MAYIKLTDGTAYSNPSYTIRGFISNTVPSLLTTYDSEYHSSTYLGTLTVGGTIDKSVSNPEGWVGGAGMNQTALGSLIQGDLDSYTQSAIESGAFLSNNADGSYNNGISVVITAGGTATLESSYNDNLQVSPFDQAGTYYLQMPIWGMPGTAATARLNLASSNIQFTSSGTWNPSQTATIAFSSGSLVNSMAVAGSGSSDLIWKVNRTFLSSAGVDTTDVKRIRFNLVGSGAGNFTFKTGPMKLVSSTYLHNAADVDTKLGVLKQERWPGTAQPSFPQLVNNLVSVKDYTHIMKFYIGDTSPGTATPNVANAYTRVKSDRSVYLKTALSVDNTKMKVELSEIASLKTSFTTPAPTAGYYYLVIKHIGSKVKVQLYNGQESFFTTLRGESEWWNIADTWLNGSSSATAGEGYVGYYLGPTNGNFWLDNIFSNGVVLAQYESKTFYSNTPVVGASIFTEGAGDVNLFSVTESSFVKTTSTDNLNLGIPETGPLDTDVQIVTDTEVKYSTQSLRVTKTPNAYIGSIEHPSSIRINEFSNLTFRCKLRFEEPLNTGTFKIIFWDKDRTKIAFIQTLNPMASNKWNDIEVPILSSNVADNDFIVEFGHFGSVSTTGSYWVEDIHLDYESIVWEASNDGGLEYIPFLNATNSQYKAINFPIDQYYQELFNTSPVLLWTFNQPTDYFGTVVHNDLPMGTCDGYLYDAGGGLYNSIHWIKTPTTLIQSSGAPYSISSPISRDQSNPVLLFGGGGTIVSNTTVPVSGSAFSVETWFCTSNSSGTHTLVEMGTARANNDWYIQAKGGTAIEFVAVGVGTTSITNSYANGTWHHLVAVYDKVESGKVKLFVDGTLGGSGTGTATLNSNKQIRAYSSGSVSVTPVFDSTNIWRTQDALCITNKVLPEEDIIRHYNQSNRQFNALKVRATAYIKNSWILGYELIPKYARGGLIKDNPRKTVNLSEGVISTDTALYSDGTEMQQITFDTDTFDSSEARYGLE